MTGAGIEPAACGLKEPVRLGLTRATRASSARLVPTGGQAVPSITSCPEPYRARVPRLVPRSESPAVATLLRRLTASRRGTGPPRLALTNEHSRVRFTTLTSL